MIVINNKEYNKIYNFDVINEFQFLAQTEYGYTYFDMTMVFDGKSFIHSQDAVDYIISILTPSEDDNTGIE
jgi:hypothetical protein